jgi:hypothetical protein
MPLIQDSQRPSVTPQSSLTVADSAWTLQRIDPAHIGTYALPRMTLVSWPLEMVDADSWYELPYP